MRIFRDHSLSYSQVSFKMRAYVVGRPYVYFTAQNVLLRNNGHFKMALNISTLAVKSIRFIQCIVLANQKNSYAKRHCNVKYILNGYLLFFLSMR